MKSDLPYRKHIYWLSREQVESLGSEMADRGVKLKFAKGIVCTPLDRLNKIACVRPEVWDDTCARQGAWYRTSDKNGLYLIISSFELANYADCKRATISESDFVPPRLASIQDKKKLIADKSLTQRMPDEWRSPGEKERRIYLRWARRLGSDVREYDFLYLSHTANHANFLNPRFFVRNGGEIIPYSIDRSAHLCSCCVELFQILGAEYKRKLVCPCPGATIFARLKPDSYFLVEAS